VLKKGRQVSDRDPAILIYSGGKYCASMLSIPTRVISPSTQK